MKALRLTAVLGLAVLAAPAFAQDSEDEAGDVSEVDKDALGPLKDRIRPVSGHVFLKRMRLEVSPSFTLSVKDTFFTKYVLGASLAFHFSESFAINLRGGYALKRVSGAAQICTPGAENPLARGCAEPELDLLLGRSPGAINLVFGGDIEWAPIYGKISLVSQAFLHFDMYAILGASGIQYTGPRPTEESEPPSLMTVGGNLGIGARFFMNRWFAVRTELRDLSYVEQLQGAGRTTWRNQILFEIGLSFFLPTDFEEG